MKKKIDLSSITDISELEFQKFKAKAKILEADKKHGKIEKYVIGITASAYITHLVGLSLGNPIIVICGLSFLLIGNLSFARPVLKILSTKEDNLTIIEECDKLIEKLKKEKDIERIENLGKIPNIIKENTIINDSNSVNKAANLVNKKR